MRRAITNIVGRIMLVGIVAMLASVICATTSVHATTLAELGDELAQAQAVLDERQQAYDDSQTALRKVLGEMYKDGGMSASDVLSLTPDVTSMLNAVRYGNAMTDQVASQIQASRAARDEADQARRDVQDVIDQRQRQSESLKNADGIHFCQCSAQWGVIPYWNGTIATHGCGLVSYTVAIDILTGRNATPDQILSERGDWAGTEQTITSTEGSRSGKTHEQVTRELYGVETESLGMDGDRMRTLDYALGEESVVQVCAAGSAFKNNGGHWRYSNGHYIVVYRKDDSGNYYVQDSSWGDENGRAVCYSPSEMARMLGLAHTMTMYHN